MQFKEPRGIYLQIAETLMDRLLAQPAAKGPFGEGRPEDGLPDGPLGLGEEKFPSIRETAEEFGVNPNTVMRSYAFLQELDVIYNRRGIGFFVDHRGRQKIIDWKRRVFIDEELPEVFKTMDLLRMSVKELQEQYREYARRKR